MRRILVPLLVSVLAMVGVSAVPSPSASAAPTITGSLRDSTTDAGVPGVVVRLRQVTDSGPGPVVDSDTTSSAGAFSLGAPAGPRYYVQVVAGRYQAGYVGGSPRYAQAALSDANTYPSGASLGPVLVNPAFIRGVVVDAATKQPVRGAKVTARTFDDPSAVEAAASTDRAGRFTLTGITFEDNGYLKINGSSVAHETGYVACGLGVVVSFDEACASPLGVIDGKIRLDPTSGRARPVGDVRPIKPGRIGKTTTAMTIKQAYATGEFDKNVPNPPCDPIKLRPTGVWKSRYVVLTANGKVVEMAVNGKRPRTGAGLGVGSTAGQVYDEYGSAASKPQEAGYNQWATFVHVGSGASRRWIGFLYGNAFPADGPLVDGDEVTLVAVSTGKRPGLALDGC